MSDSFDSMNNVNWPDVVVLLILFMVFSNRQTYSMVAGLINSVLPDVELVDEDGHATMMGQALHGLLLGLLWPVVQPMLKGM